MPILFVMWLPALFCAVSAFKSPLTCPAPCQCDAGVIDCSNTGSTAIPQGLPLNTSTLRLDNNDLSELWHGVFSPLPVVREINLANNDVAYVGAHSFFAQPFLRKLNLAHNSIEYLLDNAFSGLRLIKLNLDSNPLRELSENAFVNTTIEELSLNDCRLRTLPATLFRDMIGTLRVLNINNNQFPLQLPEGVFAYLHFSDLSLKYNGMRNLRCLANASVNKLELSGNPLGDVVWLGLHQMTSLKEIFCHGCGIRSFSITQYIPSLTTISLEDNSIKAFDDLSLSKVPNLRTLNLHNNRIRHLSESFDHHLQKLSVLDLSWNFLDDLKAESIDETSLTYLDLSENNLMTMPKYLRPVLSEIRTVVLYGNPFRCNCLMLWFYRWTKSLTWRDTQIWGAECLYPKSAPLIKYRPDELVCKGPEIKTATNAQTQNATVTCHGTGEPLPVVELVLPSGERVVKYPDQNEARGEITIVHTVTSFNCSVHLKYVCSASNFVSNTSEVIMLTKECSGDSNSATNETFSQTVQSFQNFSDVTIYTHLQPAAYNDSVNATASNSSQGPDISWKSHNTSWNLPGNGSLDYTTMATMLTMSDNLENLNNFTLETGNLNISENVLVMVTKPAEPAQDFIIGFNETSDIQDLPFITNITLHSVFNVTQNKNKSEQAESVIDKNISEPNIMNISSTKNETETIGIIDSLAFAYNETDIFQNVTLLGTYDTNLTLAMKQDFNFTANLMNNSSDWWWFASQMPEGSSSNRSYVVELPGGATTWIRSTLVTILKGCIGFVVVIVSVTLIIVIGKVIYHNSNNRMDYNLSKQRAEFVRNHLMKTMRIIRPISSSNLAEKHESRH